MPTTFVGLVLFVLLLAPGLTYRVYRAPTVSVQKLSALREVGGVVLRSAAFDGLALAVFGLLRALFPGTTPDVGALVRYHSAYLRDHYLRIAWWSVLALAFACLMAVFSARFVASNAAQTLCERRPLRWFMPRGQVTDDSAWHIVRQTNPKHRAFVGLKLNDGEYLDGYLWMLSADSEETADRDIVLNDPRVQGAESEDPPEAMDADVAIVSARNIRYMTVSWLDQDADDAAPPGPPQPGRRPTPDLGPESAPRPPS